MSKITLMIIGIVAGWALAAIYPSHATQAIIAVSVLLAVVLWMLRSSKRSAAKLNQVAALRLSQIIDQQRRSDLLPDYPEEP